MSHESRHSNVTLGGAHEGLVGVWAGATSLAASGSGTSCDGWTSSSSSLTGRTGIASSSAIGTYYLSTVYPCSITTPRLHCLEE
jgi:hypothetical protein